MSQVATDNRSDGRQTFASYIRHARSSNYTLETALHELSDNSLEHGSTFVEVRFSTKNKALKKIEHFDDGNGIQHLTAVFTHGYHRNRDDSGCGRYGIGMKIIPVKCKMVKCFYRRTVQ